MYGSDEDLSGDKNQDFLFGSDDPYTVQDKPILSPEEKAQKVLDRHLGDIPKMIDHLIAELDQRIGSQIDKFTDLVHELEQNLD